MGRIDRCPDEEIQFRALFDQKLCQPGRAVVRIQFIEELCVELIVHVLLQKLQTAAQGQDALGHQIDPFDLRRGRHIRIAAVDPGHDLFPQNAGRDVGAGPAGNHLLPFRMHKVVHQSAVILFRLRRAGEDIDDLSLDHPGHGHRRVIPRLLLIQFLAGLAEHNSQPGGRHTLLRTFQGIVRHRLPGPTVQIQDGSGACVDNAVAHEDEAVVLLHGEIVFMYFLPPDLPDLIGIIDDPPVPDEDAGGIVKFRQVCPAVVIDLKDGKCGIGHFPDAAHRERPGDGLHTGFDLRPFPEHGPQDPGGERGQDIRLDAASHAVRQDQDVRLLRLQDLHFIPAQFLLMLIQAFPCRIDTHTHTHSSSFRMESLSFVSVTFVSAVVSPRSPAISWATIICFSMTFWAISTVSIFRL